MLAVAAEALPALDEALRAEAHPAWAALAAEARGADPVAWTRLALAASHPDPGVRAAAVVRLGDAGDGRAIRFVLLRLGDPTGAVRAAARGALVPYLSSEYARHVSAALPLARAVAPPDLLAALERMTS